MSKKKAAHKAAAASTATAPVTKKLPKVSSESSMGTWFMLLLCILPFAFSRTIVDPVIVPRFLILTFFMAAFVLYFYLLKSGKILLTGLPKWVFIIGAAFFAWNIVSLTGAVNPNAASFELTRVFINLVLLLIVMDMFSKDETALLRISKVILFVGIIHSFVAIVQYYGVGFKDLPGANALPYGLMANRNLFGSAQVFIVPFILYVMYAGTKNWKLFAGFSLFMVMLAIVLSQTRSAWLAFLAMMIVALVLVMIFVKEQRKSWTITTVVAIGLTILIGVVLATVDTKGELSSELKNRTASFTNSAADTSTSQTSTNDRISIWKQTTKLVGDRPITGAGLANWNLTILNYGGKGLAWANGFYVPDRIHNVYLQMAAELGIPGLLLFLCFWGAIAFAALKGIQKAVSEKDKMLFILLLAGLTAFAADAMFSFPLERIEHSLYIMLMAGGILGNYKRVSGTDSAGKSLPKWIFGIATLVICWGIFLGFQRLTFEKNLHITKAAEKEGTPNDVLEYVARGKQPWIRLDQEGLSLETKEAEAYKKLKNYPKAVEVMTEALKLNPNSHMALSNMGTIYTEMGDYKTAVSYYEKALKSAPDFDIIKKNLALNLYNVGRYKEAIKVLESFNYQEEQIFIDVMNQSKQMAASDTSGVK